MRTMGVGLGLMGAALICAVSADAARAADWPHDGKYGHGTRHLIIRNHLSKEIYVELLSGGSGPLKSDVFALAAGKDSVYEVPNVWHASRLWGRTDSASGGPNTLIEWNMGSRDWYDISLVDGYNLPVTVAPIEGTYVKNDPADPHQCGGTGCVEDLLSACPPELSRTDAFGQVVECLSACSRFNNDEFCCRGYYDASETCRPDAWEIDYPRLFKNACPTAVTYAFDDSSDTFICPAGAEGIGPDYEVVFGALRASAEPIVARAPSPAAHRLQAMADGGALRWSVSGELRGLRLVLFDAAGRIVSEQDVASGAGVLPLPASTGAYALGLFHAGEAVESRNLQVTPAGR